MTFCANALILNGMIKTLHAKDLFLPDKPINFYFYNLPNVIPHRHGDFYEIFLILKGSGSHSFNDFQMDMHKHDYCIVRPGDRHSFTAVDGNIPTQHLNIRIQPFVFLKETAEISSSLPNMIADFTDTVQHLSKEEYLQINYWLNRLLTTTDTEQKSFFLKTTVHLFLSFFFANLSIVKSSYSSWFNSLLLKINSPEFIDKSANDIYTAAGYSSNHVIKAFNKNLGVTPTQYLMELKLNYACNLLSSTNYTILSIANTIGFYSLSYFTNTFKKHFGITPSDYRKNHAAES